MATNSMTLAQARNVQRLMYDAIMTYQAALPAEPGKPVSREAAQGLAALVKAWDTARDAARIARGRPLPGSLQHRAERTNRRVARLGPRPPVDLAEPDRAGSNATQPAGDPEPGANPPQLE